MKKEIFIMYDELLNKNVAAVVATEKSLSRNGIREWEGRYRYSIYDYYKGQKVVCNLSVVTLQQFFKHAYRPV